MRKEELNLETLHTVTPEEFQQNVFELFKYDN